jgi:hypothetical protein
MQSRLLIIALFIGQLSFGQTAKHVKIAGTKCSLVPPVGFVAATSFSGFQEAETGASIMITQLPAPYQSVVDGFTAEALKARGMELVSKQTIDFNNSKATLINLTQTSNGINYLKQILVFGIANETVLVNGIYPESARSNEAKIKEALLSTVYDPAQDDDPAAAAAFSLDTRDTEFKIAKFMSGSLLYSTDGKIPTERATLIVGSSTGNVAAGQQKQYAEDRIKKLPRGEFSLIKEVKEITIDNLKGYEIVAEGKSKDDKPELVYQVMLFNDKGEYYIILGQAKEDREKNLAAYRQIARTFKRK